VEVYGDEWAFGNDGVCRIKPGCAHNSNPNYKTPSPPIPLGRTPLTEDEVKELIQAMKADWQGSTYDLLHNNCCSFARRLLEELGVEEMPEWADGWTGKVVPAVEAGVAGAVMTVAVGPAGVGAAAGDLVCGGIGARAGGAIGGSKGAHFGKDVGGFTGSVAAGSGIGFVFAGPVGAGIGLVTGIASWSIGKALRSVQIDTVSGASRSQSQSTQQSQSD
jgi:hypothetical protein